MGKRYYCDYCDRSFQDNMHNRKKHLNGVQHHRAKKSWFDSYRDSAAILYDEQAKKPCRKFLQTGVCGFGHSCRFSHMSEEDFANLQRQIEYEQRQREEPGGRAHPERSLEEWFARRDKKRLAPGSTGALRDNEDEEADAPEIDVPPQLHNFPNLPPSLLPPPPGGWKVNMNTEWG